MNFNIDDDQKESEQRMASAPALRVVVAYEDFATGQHALNVFEHLFAIDRQLEVPLTTNNVWKFDLLEVRNFRNMAAVEATVADIIIISAHAPGELPPAVRNWMELWINQREAVPGALVFLVDDVAEESDQNIRAKDYLQTCAERAGMDFFMHKVPERTGHGESNSRMELDQARLTAKAYEKIMSVSSGFQGSCS